MSSICDRFQFLKPSVLLHEDISDENEGACMFKLTSAYGIPKSILKNLSWKSIDSGDPKKV